eukprot:PITA_29107
MQGGCPIAYESEKLLPHERLYSIYDKEILAIMHTLAKYRQYLVGNRFRVVNDRYRVVDEIIYYKDQIFLTEGSQLKKEILHASHDSPLASHQGFTKTYRAIRERFSWKGLKEDILQHIQECDICQRNKGEMSHLAGLLQPLPISEGKWESISVDFITGLPMVQGKDCIFVVVNRLTNDSKAPRAKIWIQESQDILQALKDNMATAQNQQNLYADRDRVERQFEVGDIVYLRLQPYR